MRQTSTGFDLTQGPITRRLLQMAWPAMLSSFLHNIYNLVDAFWLGKLGMTALVAPTVTMHVVFIGIAVAMGLGGGGMTLVSQYRGAGDFRSLSRAAGQTVTLLLSVSVVLAAAGLIFMRPILLFMQTPADALSDTTAYMFWILIGMPFLFAFFVYQSIHTGLGDTMSPLRVNLIAVTVNLVLDPLLIFGYGPFPAWGTAGAAIATSISYFIGCVVGFSRMLSGHSGFKLRLSDMRIDRVMLRRIVKIGLPMSAGQATTALGFTLLLGIVNTFGSAVTAAFGVGNRIIMMTMIPVFGLAQANAAAVGQNLGADRPDRASSSVKASAGLIAAILLPVTTATFFFGAAISRIFVDDPQVAQYGQDLFRITSPSVFTFGFIMVLLGAFQGAGYTVPIMVLNVGRLWLLRIPASYLLAVTLGLGPIGLWWGMFISNTATAAAAAIWFSRGSWKRKAIDSGPQAGHTDPATGVNPEPVRVAD